MPNHVTTRCIVTGTPTEVARFKQMMIVEKVEERGEHWPAERQPEAYTEFDFGAIIPMPNILVGSQSGSRAEFGSILYEIANANQFSGLGRGITLHPHELAVIDAIEVGSPDFTKKARAHLAANPDIAAAGRVRLQAMAETGYSDWYPWSIDNWGTKWGAYQFASVAEDSARFEFTFQTAWSFPTPIFEALEQEFPSLDFECLTFDEGSNFAGRGHFGSSDGERFAICDTTDELYELVYGHAPERDEEAA